MGKERRRYFSPADTSGMSAFGAQMIRLHWQEGAHSCRPQMAACGLSGQVFRNRGAAAQQLTRFLLTRGNHPRSYLFARIPFTVLLVHRRIARRRLALSLKPTFQATSSTLMRVVCRYSMASLRRTSSTIAP